MKLFCFLVLLVCLFQTVYGRRSAYDYCGLAGPNHVMCQYQGVAANCSNSRFGGLTLEQKRETLRAHNYFRNLVASGLETRGRPGPQPAARNMVKMYWHGATEKVAQRWTDQCIWGHPCLTCNTVRGTSSGQNGAIANGFTNPNLNMTQLVERWYKEIDIFNRREVTDWQWHDGDIGHYTALVWAKTYRLGCGMRDFNRIPTPSNKWAAQFFFCNYTPAGNSGRYIYYPGKAASRCPKGSTAGGDPEFPYLCSINAFERVLKRNPDRQFGKCREE